MRSPFRLSSRCPICGQLKSVTGLPWNRLQALTVRAGPMNTENVTWRLDYLLDDETPFEEDPENSRVRAA